MRRSAPISFRMHFFVMVEPEQNPFWGTSLTEGKEKSDSCLNLNKGIAAPLDLTTKQAAVALAWADSVGK